MGAIAIVIYDSKCVTYILQVDICQMNRSFY